MPFDPNQIFNHAEELLRRVSPEGRARARRIAERRRKRARRMAGRFLAACVAILAVAFAIGIFVPIGQGGVMAAALAMLLAGVAIVYTSAEPEPTPEVLGQTDLPLLPQRTEAWLETQRPALPAPAVRLLDGIGTKLDALGLQLQGLDPREPAAAEVRKLLCDDLPTLVEGYQRVPVALRREARDGPSPDKQLVDGLGVIDEEISQMTAKLAAGDLKSLATQGRYLELKYRDGDEGLTG